MKSNPPSAHETSPAVTATVRSEAFRPLEDGVIFFSVEGAPPESCRTTTRPDGSLTFETTLEGRAIAVDRDELLLRVGPRVVAVRHLLPSAVSLAPLIGQALSVRVTQRYEDRGRATIDATIHDERGRLLVWARDGRLPPDAEARGFVLRLSVDREEPRLVTQGDDLLVIRAPGSGTVTRGGVEHQLLVLRAEPGDVSFALVRS